MKHPIRYWLLLALFAGCTPNENENAIPVYTFDHEMDSKVVKLSELMEDIRIVRLETTPENQLPGSFGIVLTNSSIITIDREQILQFSSDGHFERTLAHVGPGPSEYKQIVTWSLDGKNDVLYMFDTKSPEYIRGFDLKTHEFSTRIPIPEEFLGREHYLRKILQVNDSTLACFPFPSGNLTEKMFLISYKGTLLGKLPFTPADDQKISSMMKRQFSQMVSCRLGNAVHAAGVYSDTLYTLDPGGNNPIAILKLNSPFSSETLSGQFHAGIIETPGVYLYTQNSLTIESNGDFISKFIDSKTDQYYIDKKESTVERVTGYDIDFFDFAFTERQSHFSTQDDEGIWVITAPDFIQKADSVLEAGTADMPVLDRLRSLSAEVKETDNNILLIGKVK